ncbi:MAG: hypothetical protein JWQ15_1343 [Marmoricola sp.]|nr:hypothetical protein [Marmoricola sp.]
MKSAAKRILLEALGWILVLVGIAALLLPGPGLLALFAGVALLATQYEWAERRLESVKKAALRTAADSVRTWPRILMSSVGVVWLVALGIYWGHSPPAPTWWPIDDRWWLMGGWGTGATLVGSGIIAGVMVVYSYVHFRETRERQEEEAQPHP